MRRWTKRLALGAGCALFCAAAAQAGEASDPEIAEMRALVEQLQGQVDAQAEQIDAQGDTIQEAQEREGTREARSGIGGFFSEVEIGGWVATSYWYNFNNPPGDELTDANQGRDGSFYPFHPDSNSFQVDQVWFEIEKPVTPESRAGFYLDMAYGLTAAQLGGVTARTSDSDSANSFDLYQAYIQYLIPWGGITLKAGKYGTLLGAEVVQTVYNYNVTTGNVYNLMQPISHYGVILDGEIGNFTWSLGGVNGECCGIDPDNNSEKHLLAGAGYGGETWSVGTNILWGVANYGDSSATGTVDVLASWNPSERFGAWVNFDYKWAPNNSTFAGSSPAGWGLALAGRVGILENLGFALRGEVLQDSDQLFGISDGNGNGTGTDVYGITGTLDWTIYENLVAKVEVRYDKVNIINGKDDSVFINKNGNFSRSDQVVTGVELSYMF